MYIIYKGSILLQPSRQHSCCIGKRLREGGVGAVAYGTVGEGSGKWLLVPNVPVRGSFVRWFVLAIKERTC